MSAADLAFHTETGRLALDWIATLGYRHGDEIERITGPADLARWLEEVAGSPVSAEPTGLDLADARRLRGAIVGLLDALHAGERPEARDISTVNTFAAIPPRTARLSESGTSIEKGGASTPSSVFGAIARDAIDLVTGDDLARVRLCAADDCSVYFVDHSRPGQRRWCSMSRCGNTAKKKRFNARHGQRP